MKRRLLPFIILFSLLFSFSLKALNDFNITADNNEFFILGENAKAEEIAEIFSIKEDELQQYISQNAIVYIAVNKNNSKQIRLSSSKSSFSESVINLSNLSDDEISSISSQFSDSENDSREILKKGEQKFLKISSSLSDSGGDYTLTKYVTVAGGKNYILSFYTSKDTDNSYITEVFESFSAKDFLKSEENPNNNKFILLICLLSGIIVFILITFLRDFIKSRKQNQT